jgi:putative addiction module CopG family antidote
MHVNLPSDVDQFVKELVVAGKYPSEQEAIAEGLRLLMSREQLKVEIAKAAQQLDEGLGLEEDEVFAEVEAVIASIEKHQCGK